MKPPPYVPEDGRPGFAQERVFHIERYRLGPDVRIEESEIRMRDGVLLGATVYRPVSATAPVPVVLAVTPYGRDRFDQWELFDDPPVGTVPGGGFYAGTIRFSDHTAFEAPDPGFWVPNGYAVVVVDLPGLGTSMSNPSAGPGIEARLADAVEWSASRDWSSGAVGMCGVSALCVAQWVAAKDPAPPALRAVIPWEGYAEDGPAARFGGVEEVAFPAWLRDVWLRPNINPAAAGPEPSSREWHLDSDTITVPALVCASFSDQELHTWGSFDAFTRMPAEHKWLYGHRRQKWAAFYGGSELALQLAFFERFLKDDADAMSAQPAVRVEINEDRYRYRIRTAESWPLPSTAPRELSLDAASASLVAGSAPPSSTDLDLVPPDTAGGSAAFVLRFEEDTEITGTMGVRLLIEAIGTDDVDLFAAVEKLDTSGNVVYFFSASGGNANGPVTRGWLRASRRGLDDRRSTPVRPVLAFGPPQPLPERTPTTVEFPLMPSGTLFRRGESLRLVLTTWSLAGRWEGGVGLRWRSPSTGAIRIHTGGGSGSRLVVPIIPPAGG